jgi:small nuclear ribonucleoprotein (snRNP)-like protein
LIEECIGNKAFIIMKDEKELVGELKGFDEYIS